MGTERLTAADAAWLRLDRPENLMVVTAVLWLGAPVDHGALRARLAERLVAAHPRFRSVVRERPLPLLPPEWVPDPAFDLDRHLTVVELGERDAGEAALQRLVGAYLARPLDAAAQTALAGRARRRVPAAPGRAGALRARVAACTTHSPTARRSCGSCSTLPTGRRLPLNRLNRPIAASCASPPGWPSPYPAPRSGCSCCRRSRAPRCAARSGSPRIAAWAAPRSLAESRPRRPSTARR